MFGRSDQLDRSFGDVTTLTNLVCLDLTGCHKPGIYGHDLESAGPWDTFLAWPALRVFKFGGCWLIGESTVFNAATVQELHTDRLAVGMEAPCIHLAPGLWGNLDVLGLIATVWSPVWCDRIVDLRVSCYVRYRSASCLGDAVTQVMQVCRFLRTFHFCVQTSSNSGEVSVVLGEDYSGQLTELRLEHLHCSEMDLRSATDLTSITLADIDSFSIPCKLSLPDCVASMQFLGSTLFRPGAQHSLQELTKLSRLTLGTNKPDFMSQHARGQQMLDTCTCIPTLPSSLCHLHITCHHLQHLLQFSAHRCLQACTSLAHLTLPGLIYDGELSAWKKAARHLHCEDKDPGSR